MTDGVMSCGVTEPGPLPPGYTTNTHYPQPGNDTLMWAPATAEHPGHWTPVRIRDRRLRSHHAITAQTQHSREHPVRSRPVHHYATAEVQP